MWWPAGVLCSRSAKHSDMLHGKKVRCRCTFWWVVNRWGLCCESDFIARYVAIDHFASWAAFLASGCRGAGGVRGGRGAGGDVTA
jgi:hypothetical protein